MSEPQGDYAPGSGPAMKVSVSLYAGNVRAVRKRVGARGFSAYVNAAVQRQIERDLLEELLQANEAAVGPISDELREEAAAIFREIKSDPSLRNENEWQAREAS